MRTSNVPETNLAYVCRIEFVLENLEVSESICAATARSVFDCKNDVGKVALKLVFCKKNLSPHGRYLPRRIAKPSADPKRSDTEIAMTPRYGNT